MPANWKCVNPLFAAALPQASQLTGGAGDAVTLCSLPMGQRTPDKIFFAHIGGVPYQLLHFHPGDPVGSTLTAADWTRILGVDPEHYNYDGIDPHMYEFYQPRQNVTNVTFDPGGTNPLAVATGPSSADPISGREWITDQEAMPNGHILHVDRQYACIFPIPPRDCTMPINNAYNCDCPATTTALTHDQTPPLCNDTNATQQVAAKAYPTARELLVAKMMGAQGIVSSICPQETKDTTNPVYGYRPAVAAMIDRFKGALSSPCFACSLLVDPQSGKVPCLVLVTLPRRPGDSCTQPTCDVAFGLAVPPASVLSTFCASQENQFVQSGGVRGAPGDPALQSVCQLTELTPSANPRDFAGGSCANSPDRGWCYVTGPAAGSCAQAIVIANGTLPPGSVTNLQCTQ
jgi:hypothetical protein